MPLTVYVKILDEGIDVWRPLPATPLNSPKAFLLGASGDYDSKNEKLEFQPGDEVLCEPRKIENEVELVAIEAIGESDRQKLARSLNANFKGEFEIVDISPLSWRLVHKSTNRSIPITASMMMGERWDEFLRGEIDRFLQARS